MTPYELVVRRSGLLMWIFAVTGVPFIVFGVDILFERRLATTLTDLIYPSERVQPPPFETHDLAWAWVLLIAGSAITAWALKELIAPRRVVRADHRGVSFAVAGPFAAGVQLPWGAIESFTADLHHDEGGTYDVLRVDVSEPERLPRQPWGARWADESTLLIAANEWEAPASAVADRLTEMHAEALETAEEEQVDAPPVWRETSRNPEGPWVRDDADEHDVALDEEPDDEAETIDDDPIGDESIDTDSDEDDE